MGLGPHWVILGLYLGYIGIMEKKMETTLDLGLRVSGFRIQGLGLGLMLQLVSVPRVWGLMFTFPIL